MRESPNARRVRLTTGFVGEEKGRVRPKVAETKKVRQMRGRCCDDAAVAAARTTTPVEAR